MRAVRHPVCERPLNITAPSKHFGVQCWLHGLETPDSPLAYPFAEHHGPPELVMSQTGFAGASASVSSKRQVTEYKAQPAFVEVRAWRPRASGLWELTAKTVLLT